MNKLLTHYSYDECTDENLLFEKLNQLVDDSKISYKIEEKYIFKIEDLELTDEDIKDDIQMFRVGLLIGAGIEYSLSGNTAIVAGVTYNNGFTNTLRGDHVQTDEADEVVFENQKQV